MGLFSNRRKGALIISGCPRSGTSLNMLIQREVQGEENILGKEFPHETRAALRKQLLERQEEEPRHTWEIRRYLTQKALDEEEALTPQAEKDVRDMNPDGFWECPFSVNGLNPYLPQPRGPAVYSAKLQEDLDNILSSKRLQVCKVVSQGLLLSNPAYIGKIVYSIRHPRAVAKSQEDLRGRGENYIGEDGKVHEMFEGIPIHTPDMFIRVTLMASKFFLKNPDIPVHFIHFEDLISTPVAVIQRIGRFVKEGDYSKAYSVVNPKLSRSKHEDVPSPLWEDAEYVYREFSKAAAIINEYLGENPRKLRKQREKAAPVLTELLQYMADPRRNTNKESASWKCYRARRMVNARFCQECIKGGALMQSFRRQSEATPSQLGVTRHWSQEPCLFECGMDVDRNPEEYSTIEESIKNNFWDKEDTQHKEKEDGTSNQSLAATGK